MPNWIIEAEGEAREVYACAAETEDEARLLFDRGECENIGPTEISGSTIVRIDEE